MLKDFLENQFCLMVKTSEADGYGSFKNSYTEGTKFYAGLVTSSSSKVQVSDKDSTEVGFTLVYTDDVTIVGGDRVKRLKDGALFEALSYSADMMPPGIASPFMQHKEVTLKRVTE